MGKRDKKFIRTALKFEVGSNIPAFLSYAARVDGKRGGKVWSAIKIVHGMSFQDPRVDERNRGELKKYFRDYYFIDTIGEHEWKLGYFLNILGGKACTTYIKDNIDSYIDCTIQEINKYKGTKYFLKTRIIDSKDKLYLNRGLHPYVSKEDNLSYRDGEDEHHQFIVNK